MLRRAISRPLVFMLARSQSALRTQSSGSICGGETKKTRCGFLQDKMSRNDYKLPALKAWFTCGSQQNDTHTGPVGHHMPAGALIDCHQFN